MTSSILGVDIAKDKFDCVLLSNNASHANAFNNTASGWKQLQAWLRKLGAKQVHVCLEATGRLWEGVAAYLHERGHTVSVVNPARIKHFARSLLSRNKNDQVDAQLIARFCQQQTPDAWTPPSPAQRVLQDLTRLISSRKLQLVQEKNRLKSGVKTPFVIRDIKATIKNLQASIRSLEAEIRKVIASDAELAAQAKLLCTIKSISVRTASVILAELPDVTRFERASQVAAYAGVSPAHKQSGTSLQGRTRLCKTGNRRLRLALYFPAIVACKCNPILKARAQRLLATGKSKMCVIGAIMHHLLRMAYGVLKHQKPFDPKWRTEAKAA